MRMARGDRGCRWFRPVSVVGSCYSLERLIRSGGFAAIAGDVGFSLICIFYVWTQLGLPFRSRLFELCFYAFLQMSVASHQYRPLD